MGNSFSRWIEDETSKGDGDSKKNIQEIRQMMQVLEAKRDEFVYRLNKVRGKNADSTTEVAGGRTVMRISKVGAKCGGGADANMRLAISDFFECAQGGAKAKNSAVEGVKTMIGNSIESIFAVQAGSGQEKQAFVVMFINGTAFVRVDFFVYAYCAVGNDGWSGADSKSGSCYVADLSVLETSTLEASEIDYLLSCNLVCKPPNDDDEDSDAWAAGQRDLELIMNTKIMLCESALLSRMLKSADMDFAKIRAVSSELALTQKKVKSNYAEMADYNPKADIEDVQNMKKKAGASAAAGGAAAAASS